VRARVTIAATLVAALTLVGNCWVGPSEAPPTDLPTPSRPGGSVASVPPVPSASSASSATGIPEFSSVWIIVLENHDYAQVVDSGDLPYMRGLIDRYGLAESYFGVDRPSQPNYLAMFSGSTHGVTDNEKHDIDAPTVADQIEASGRTWREHAENVPPNCFTGDGAEGGRDGPGEYRRKHAPAISFTSISADPTRCAFIEDFTAFRPGAVDFALIVPNQCHDAHDCPLAEADAWLAQVVPRIVESEAFRTGGALFVTFDEDDGKDPDGGHVAMMVISPLVAAGTRSSRRYDHYSLLRTIEDAWELDCLAKACEAEPMTDFFAAR
jgi:hypothetical protein